MEHMDEVEECVDLLGKIEGVSLEDRFVLRTAAKIHDSVYVLGRKDNEEQSMVLARPYLVDTGYTRLQIDKVSNLVLATKIPTHPNDLLEMIICDADVQNPGTDGFWRKNERIREELGLDEKTFYTVISPNFLNNLHYYTKSAQSLFNAKVEENRKLIEEYAQRWKPCSSPDGR
jgi:predicted metal-dependent HD superfamily phosphohydrolase